MKFAALEPDGPRRQCHVCGRSVRLEVSSFGDATCPACGSLLWPYPPPGSQVVSARRSLESLGAKFAMDLEFDAWHVDLSDSDADDRALRLLPELGPITELYLSNTSVSDAGVTALSALPSQEVLELDSTRVSNRFLPVLGRFRRIEVLGLNDTRVSEAGLAELNPLRSLWCLDLDGTSVRGHSFSGLRWLRHVEWLFLANTRIDDTGLGHLRSARRLEQLWIDGAPASSAAIRRLQAALPACVVHQTREE